MPVQGHASSEAAADLLEVERIPICVCVLDTMYRCKTVDSSGYAFDRIN